MTNRDQAGRFATAQAGNAGGTSVNPATDPAPSSKPLAGSPDVASGGPKPGQDDWGSTRDALMKNATAPVRGPSLGGSGGGRPEAPDDDQGDALRSMGYGPDETKDKKEEGSQYEVHIPNDDDPGADDPGSDPGSGGDDFGGAPGGGPSPVPPGGAGPALRAMGYGDNESAGTHIVAAPGGPSYHGRDIPGSGMPGPGALPGAAEGAEEGAAAGPEGVAAGAVLGLLGSKGGGAPPVLPLL